MNKTLISTLCLVCAALVAGSANAASDFNPGRRSITDQPVAISKGHSLKTADNEALLQTARTPKTNPALRGAPAKSKAKGISARPAKSAARAAENFGTTSRTYFESFEACTLFAPTLPAGWDQQAKGTVQLEDMDRWIGLSKDYTSYYMSPSPVDGNMAMGIFYNDDAYKDEWLYSPAIEIDGEGRELSFYWYTVPYTLFIIDRWHVQNDEFIDRELAFDVEVYAREAGSGDEWTRIFYLSDLFDEVPYTEIMDLLPIEMQRATVGLDAFAGKTVEFAFRYYGEAGNTFYMDAISVDFPITQPFYTPDYSRLFFGFSPDEYMYWLEASVEFYPADHPVTWSNESPKAWTSDFNWEYQTIDENGQVIYETATTRDLSVTYPLDYVTEGALMNNIFPQPTLRQRNAQGGIGTYTSHIPYLQAGGTTEFDYHTGGQPDVVKYVALPFDIINEGFSLHLEDNEQYGLAWTPIFGLNENTDAWWYHYSYPDDTEINPEKYAYCDGFANLYFPHPSAPMVVNGVAAAAVGTVDDDAEFTATVYTMSYDPEEDRGFLVEPPLVQKTIKGSDLIKIDGPNTHSYLSMNFDFDEPLIFDSKGTEYGYVVLISGYHDPEHVSYFCPIQSIAPNPYEWCLGFYRHCNQWNEGINEELTSVYNFTDDNDENLLSSFAIGLDAHYPWLMLEDNGDETFVPFEGAMTFNVRGYFDASQYKVEAPEGFSVALNGRYTTGVTVTPQAPILNDCEVPVTLSAPGVKLTVNVPFKASDALGSIEADTNTTHDLYNAQGILLQKNATTESLKALPAGLYILGSQKVLVR